MRLVDAETTAAWKAEAKIGSDRRPMQRATISRFRLKKFPYDTAWAPGDGDMDWATLKQREGTFTSALFGGDMDVREIKNILSISWDRSVDQDVASCTIVLLNSDLTPIGNQERVEHSEDFDMPGFFTYNRGGDESIERWGFEDSGWEDIFIPDRIVKTYEGYGSVQGQPPGLDPNLYPSGTWLVDDVTYTHDGKITLTCRDIGKLLIDQIVFPPVIPYPEYPLTWSPIRSEMVTGREPFGGTWSQAILDEGSARSSNDLYDVEEDDDPDTSAPYVGPDVGVVQGHTAEDALATVVAVPEGEPDPPAPYWLSTGQERRDNRVWWEFDFDDPRSVAALRITAFGGPYRIYVSVMDSTGRWKGKRKIPYDSALATKGVDVYAGKPFVKTEIADRGRAFDVVLKQVYHDIVRVRITFTHLWDSKSSIAYPWRAGLRSVYIYRNEESDPDGEDMYIDQGEHLEVVGNYRDYTDIVKWVCAWGGFYWPGHGQEDGGGDMAEDYVRLGWVGPTGGMVNLKRWVKWETPDPRLARGRVWGDFMNTGTHNALGGDLTVDMFDKQPLMDVISYIRDVTGFLFFVDELGGAIWRMPNCFKKGNYLSPVDLGAHTRRRTTQYVTIDEEETLLSMSVKVSAASNREVIFVANLTGNYGVAIEGYAPSDARMRRTAGWTDAKFESRRETRVMADLIATQQMFNYREATITIPGNPAIQIDDQIKVYERVTNDTYFHYVKGISSQWDADTGVWTYTLQTHWLGEDEDSWVMDTTLLASVTQQYLNALNVTAFDNEVGASVEDEEAE